MPEDLSRREQIDLALLRRVNRDPAARDRLAERLTPLVRSIARKYQARSEPMDDIVQAGMIGLVKAIDRFDPTSGHRFVSFAIPNIQGEIRRHFRDHTWAVHVPRAMQELDARTQITSRRIVTETGREPTDAALSHELGATTSEIEQARTAGLAYRALSLDAPAGENRDALSTFGSTDPGYGEVDNRDTVASAMEALDEREQKVVRLRYTDERLQREIAAEVGLSQMQISRILIQAQSRMRDHLGGGPARVAA